VALSQRSKILLNVHQDEIPYFEWHRMILLGIWQDTLVISEPCFRVPGLDPGTHFVECELDDLPGTIEWFLESEPGIEEAERIRSRARTWLRSHYGLEEITRNLVANVMT